MKFKIKKVNSNLRQKVLFGCLILSVLFLQLVFVWNTSLNNKFEEFNNMETSAIWPISTPIYIDDLDPNYNWSKTAEDNLWCSGNGTASEPYLIENVILDAQGGSFSCLTIKNSNVDFKIKNCKFFNTINWDNYGIILINVINGTLIANNCSYNGGDGIRLENSNGIRITANVVHNNYHGIYMDLSSNNPITYNDVYSNIYGMTLSTSHNNQIKYNDVYWNEEWGIYISGSNSNTLTSNKIFENCLDDNNFGLYLDNCDYNNITDNLINKNNDRGLWLLNSGHNNIRNNTISESLYGLISNQGDYNTIINNTIENISIVGMEIRSCHYNNITENIINNTKSHGLNIFNCDYSNIRGNIINNTQQYGITLVNSDESHIIGNSIENSGNTGILLTNCHLNDIIDNIVSNSKSFGMSLINSEIYTVANNSLTNCGYNIEGSLALISNLEMNTSNLVNGKPLHFYYNISGLTQIHFPNTGQIILYSCDSAVLSNMNFNNCSLGIALHYCERPTLTGITSSFNNRGGFYLRECNNVQISGNVLSQNGGNGIYLQDCNSSSILDNTINLNGGGIAVANQFNITIRNNDINENVGMGISVGPSIFSTIRDNIVNNNGYGIGLSGHNATISENIASYNKINGIVVDCFDVVISGNTLNSNYETSQVGIKLSGGRITVSDNVVYNNHKALMLHGVKDSRIINNDFSTNIVFQVHYIDVDSCSFVEFKNNKFEGVGVSAMIIRLRYSSNNIFINNDLLMGGFRLENSMNNQFLGNYIKDNGIAFDLEDSSFNIITNNTMINVMQCYREWGNCTANVFENNYCEVAGRIPIPNIIGAIIGLCGVGIVTTVMLLKRRRINREYKESEI